MGSRAVVMIDRLNTSAGGEATLTDFAVAFADATGSVDVLVAKSYFWHRLRLRRSISERAHPNLTIRVRPVARILDFRVARSVVRSDFWGQSPKRPTALRFLLDWRRAAARRILWKADLVLVSQVLTDQGVAQLAKQVCPGALLVLNHNGEPALFFDKWKSSSAPSDPEEALSKYRAYLAKFSQIVFQSSGQESIFRSSHPDFPGVTSVIWPSLDEKKCLRAAKKNGFFSQAHVNVLCVAKFQSGKHQRELISAFSQLTRGFPEAHLTLIGASSSEHDYLDSCHRLVDELNLQSRVTITGRRADVLSFIADCDVLVLASSGEGVSRAIREGAFFAKPIVCTDLPGLRTFLGRGGAMFVSKPTPELISSALRTVLSNPHLQKELSIRSREAYMEKASWQSFAASVSSLANSPNGGRESCEP